MAIVVPEAEEALKWAAAKGVAAPSVAALLAQPEHAAALAQEIQPLTLTPTLALALTLTLPLPLPLTLTVALEQAREFEREDGMPVDIYIVVTQDAEPAGGESAAVDGGRFVSQVPATGLGYS